MVNLTNSVVLLKGQDFANNNLHTMDKSCYSLLLFLKQSNSDFSINKCEDAIHQFDSLTDRLTLSVTDSPVTRAGKKPKQEIEEFR